MTVDGEVILSAGGLVTERLSTPKIMLFESGFVSVYLWSLDFRFRSGEENMEKI